MIKLLFWTSLEEFHNTNLNRQTFLSTSAETCRGTEEQQFDKAQKTGCQQNFCQNTHNNIIRGLADKKFKWEER